MAMEMHCVRRGSGRPLLLIHGLGGSWRSWQLITDSLVDAGREVIAVDLPGHGDTPPLAGEASIRTLADAVAGFLEAHQLSGIDAVGSSMGGLIALELARRGGLVGAVVALDPGGFWKGWEVPVFYYSLAGSVRLVRMMEPVLPAVTGNPVTRTALLAQFSAHPWSVPSQLALDEMQSLVACSSYDELLHQLAWGERLEGAPAGSIRAPLVIVWGRKDRVAPPRQAVRVRALFPDARLHWFADCGHFPHWDKPEKTARLILAAIGAEFVPVPIERTGSASPLRAAAAFAAGVAVAMGSLWLMRRRRAPRQPALLR